MDLKLFREPERPGLYFCCFRLEQFMWTIMMTVTSALELNSTCGDGRLCFVTAMSSPKITTGQNTESVSSLSNFGLFQQVSMKSVHFHEALSSRCFSWFHANLHDEQWSVRTVLLWRQCSWFLLRPLAQTTQERLHEVHGERSSGIGQPRPEVLGQTGHEPSHWLRPEVHHLVLPERWQYRGVWASSAKFWWVSFFCSLHLFSTIHTLMNLFLLCSQAS